MLKMVEDKPMATDWSEIAAAVAETIAPHCERHDADDSFVEEGFAELDRRGLFRRAGAGRVGRR